MLCAGIVASATLNVWREKGTPPFTPNDFLPAERLSDEEIEARAVAFFENLFRRQEAEIRTKRK